MRVLNRNWSLGVLLSLFLFSCEGESEYNIESKQSFDTLQLYLPIASEGVLDGYVADAEKREIIPEKDKSYVDAFILNNLDSVRIKMRLKGDWTDHLRYGNPSYRIKIEGDYAYHGFKSFSIQHPKTRNFTYEWIIHKIAEMEDVLCTRYEYVNVELNDETYGFYALEEHFSKQLLEGRNRREGPILKLDESGTWELLESGLPLKQNLEMPYFEASRADAFKTKRIKKSESLSNQFIEGSRLLTLFKNGHVKVEDIFDIESLAKFYVLMELSGSPHGLRWHNRRFYYNPITQKLEHIIFDVVPYSTEKDLFISIIEKKLKASKKSAVFCFDNAILLSREFKETYLRILTEKTQEAYLDSVFAVIDPELLDLNAIFETEEFEHEFKRDDFYVHLDYLRKGISRLDSLWELELKTVESFNDWIYSPDYKPRQDHLFASHISLNTYVEKLDSSYHLSFENYHPNSISIVAYKAKDLDTPILLSEPIHLNGFSKMIDTAEFLVNFKPKKIYFTVSNNPGLIVTKKVLPWAKPEGPTARMTLQHQFTKSRSYYSVQNNHVIFSGDIVIDSLLYIPEDYEVHIKSGTNVEFKTGGGIIATNSFFAEGTPLNPIRFFCTDSSSNGITILKGSAAVLSHCSFEGLSNLNYENWELTGAITVYETPTFINNCVIKGNYSEDALNIIRSDFNISDLHISETYSDGFDADFCTGHLEKSTFVNTGNDCVDFSGSTISIESIAITNSGDKGISGGEASVLSLNDITIDGAVTGIAAKDGSVITGVNINITTVEYAFAAFRKKSEYGGAQIKLDAVSINLAKEKFLVELASSINVNGTQTIGTEKLDIEAMYARFE